MRREGVRVLQAEDVADNEIISIASTCQLTVVSDDSDYLLHGLSVITISSIDYLHVRNKADDDLDNTRVANTNEGSDSDEYFDCLELSSTSERRLANEMNSTDKSFSSRTRLHPPVDAGNTNISRSITVKQEPLSDSSETVSKTSGPSNFFIKCKIFDHNKFYEVCSVMKCIGYVLFFSMFHF